MKKVKGNLTKRCCDGDFLGPCPQIFRASSCMSVYHFSSTRFDISSNPHKSDSDGIKFYADLVSSS